jgi:sigma-B regulation protein RsbU (phosphoserine phosphatase)
MLPRRQLVSFWLALFSSFAILGFVMDIMNRARQPWPLLALNVVVSGSFAVAFGLVGAARTARAARYAVLIALYFPFVLFGPWFPLLPEAPAGRLLFDGFGIMLTVMVSYLSFLYFINVAAARYLRAQAEIALARDIHRVLVPEIRRTVQGYEFFGWSVPSGDVGGDLVDVVETGGGWLGYVADVSGHGVGAGVVMGMFKSSVRTRARHAGSLGTLLGDVQQVLMPLKQPQMYLTAACVRGGPDGAVDCAVAGHLPILRVRDGAVDEVTVPQLALGMFDEATFTSRTVESRPGDLFAILTDGLVEVFDAQNRELGFDWAKAVIGESATAPLATIADRLISGARRHGTQLDDQTLLLIRHNRP